MNFKLTDEQKMVQENAREFANKEFPPLIKMYERQGITNEEYKQLFSIILPKFGENGFLGVTVPEKYGGFYLGSIGGTAARLGKECITNIETIEYPELGMEAISMITVKDFPAFIIVDDKRNDFFEKLLE